MISADLNLTANLPFVAVTTIVALALIWIVVRHAMKLQLGPLTISAAESAEQLNHSPRNEDGELTEPTVRVYVQAIDQRLAVLQSCVDGLCTSVELATSQHVVLADELHHTKERTAVLERLDAATAAEIAEIRLLIAAA